MRIIEAEAGEHVTDTIKRALESVKERRESAVQLWHNGTVVYVYQNSIYEDICDKYDMQRKINVLESQYRR